MNLSEIILYRLNVSSAIQPGTLLAIDQPPRRQFPALRGLVLTKSDALDLLNWRSIAVQHLASSLYKSVAYIASVLNTLSSVPTSPQPMIDEQDMELFFIFYELRSSLHLSALLGLSDMEALAIQELIWTSWILTPTNGSIWKYIGDCADYLAPCCAIVSVAVQDEEEIESTRRHSTISMPIDFEHIGGTAGNSSKVDTRSTQYHGHRR
ncbi:hypothetical protein B0O80DRAFT_498964 [Mortierella sp. GBAus27b]|nr:hypothetical protein B0O80DRAFT_498964 [Mortierella sp. GBAus27b]